MSFSSLVLSAILLIVGLEAACANRVLPPSAFLPPSGLVNNLKTTYYPPAANQTFNANGNINSFIYNLNDASYPQYFINVLSSAEIVHLVLGPSTSVPNLIVANNVELIIYGDCTIYKGGIQLIGSARVTIFGTLKFISNDSSIIVNVNARLTLAGAIYLQSSSSLNQISGGGRVTMNQSPSKTISGIDGSILGFSNVDVIFSETSSIVIQIPVVFPGTRAALLYGTTALQSGATFKSPYVAVASSTVTSTTGVGSSFVFVRNSILEVDYGSVSLGGSFTFESGSFFYVRTPLSFTSGSVVNLASNVTLVPQYCVGRGLPHPLPNIIS